MAKKSIARRLSLLLVFAWLLPGCQRQIRLKEELGASDIMASVKRLYKQSPTYQDDGIQTERYALPETAYLAKNRFRLRYDRRSDEFAFAYFPLKRSYVVKKTSAGVQTIDSRDNEPEKGESLLSALHIANGVSLGTATLIPCLLKPNEVNRSSFWGYVKQLRRIDDAELDGSPHYRLQGNYFGKTGKVDFWIAHDFSIQRIVTREPAMNELERTWDFNARVDEGLPRNSFLLDQLISIEADHETDVGKSDDRFDPQSPQGLLQKALKTEGTAQEATVSQFRDLGIDAMPAFFRLYVDTRPYGVEPGMHPLGYSYLLSVILHGTKPGESPWDIAAQEEISRRLAELLSARLPWQRLQAALDLSVAEVPVSSEVKEKFISALGELMKSDVRYQRRKAIIILSNVTKKWPAECETLIPHLTELASEQYFAIKCLGDLGKAAEPALPTLKRLRQSTSDERRRQQYDEAISQIQQSS